MWKVILIILVNFYEIKCLSKVDEKKSFNFPDDAAATSQSNGGMRFSEDSPGFRQGFLNGTVGGGAFPPNLPPSGGGNFPPSGAGNPPPTGTGGLPPNFPPSGNAPQAAPQIANPGFQPFPGGFPPVAPQPNIVNNVTTSCICVPTGSCPGGGGGGGVFPPNPPPIVPNYGDGNIDVRIISPGGVSRLLKPSELVAFAFLLLAKPIFLPHAYKPKGRRPISQLRPTGILPYVNIAKKDIFTEQPFDLTFFYLIFSLLYPEQLPL